MQWLINYIVRVQESTARDLVHETARLMRAVRHVSSPTPGDHGLTLPRAAVLRALREADGCRANDIAADLGISPSALSRHIAELEELGLLTRTTDPDDARARIAEIDARPAEEAAPAPN